MNAHDVDNVLRHHTVPDLKEVSLVGEITKSSQRVKYWDGDSGRDSGSQGSLLAWDGME